MPAPTIAARIAALMLLMGVTASAQWLNHPTAGIPRLPDGKPNLSAPVPRKPDGKPELAGLWRQSPGLTGDIARNLGTLIGLRGWWSVLPLLAVIILAIAGFRASWFRDVWVGLISASTGRG